MRFSDILMIFWLAVLAYGAFAFILPTQREINEKQAKLESLKKEKNNMEAELGKLRKETTELERGNPYRMIHVARETFKFCYPGEKIYQFPEKTNENNSTN